jgi:plasmid stability protein
MKATLDLPDDLYREVKARAAREGGTVREVAVRLFTHWLEREDAPGSSLPAVDWLQQRPPLGHLLDPTVNDHSMESVRANITRHWNG